MRRILLLAALFSVACQGDGDKPRAPAVAVAPVLTATPPPGAYTGKELQVEIVAPSDQFKMWFALDGQPDPATSEYHGRVHLRLTEPGQVRVLVADPQGRMWGPFLFTYTFANLPGSARCQVATGTSLLNGTQTVAVSVNYLVATEIDKLYLSQDGVQREVSRDELDEDGLLTFSAGPWPATGNHELGCSIAGPWPYAHRVEVTVDATPPSAAWTGSAGVFSRADWPVSLSLFASDSLAGLADVQMCSQNGCISGFGIGEGVFQYATAFTAGTHFQTEVTAVVRDQVGNLTILSPITFGIDFDEPPSLPLGPIPSTISTVVSIYEYLAPAPGGLVIAEVRKIGDFSSSRTPEALALTPGWNDFLFRQAGKTDWESFAIYRLGFQAELPPGAEPWLAYASNSTIPALNGAFLGAVTGSALYADWWDIPHVWFVQDADGSGTWGHAEVLCAPSDDPLTGPWASQAVPWVWQAQAADCDAVAAPGPDASYLVSCSDCSADGSLWMETRAGWTAFPSYHGLNTGVTAAMLQSGAAVSFPTATASLCVFFWDENENATVDGQEPRAFAACADESATLSRRNGGLRSTISGNAIEVNGLSYGGAAWLTLEMKSGADVISRRSMGVVKDVDGVGSARLPIPDDIPRVLPWFAHVTDSTSDAPLTALPEIGTADLSEQLWVRILNEYGLPFTSPAAMVFTVSGETAGGVYNGNGQATPIDVSSIGLAWTGMAFRDGYLSQTAPASETEATVYLFSKESTGLIEGQVRDSLDRPLPFANITWSAPPYQSQTMTDGEGYFSIPALGMGWLWVEGGEADQVMSQFFLMESYSYVSGIALRLPGGGATPGRGLLGDAGYLWVSGVAPVDIVSSPPYYYAAVTDGVWTQVAGAVERRFLYPGYLPSYSSQPYLSVAAPPSLGAGLTQHVACGDRQQQTGTGGTLRIDIPCWRWVFESGPETYFMGFIDEMYTVDSRVRFGTLRIDIINGHGDQLLLTDRLFGRKLYLPLIGARAEGVVAAGAYTVSLSDGTPLVEGDGAQATVYVIPGATSIYTLVKQ